MKAPYSGPIYKYIDIEGGIKSLQNRTIQFQKPSVLNDPFELSPILIKIADRKRFADDILKKNTNKSIAWKRKHRALIIAKLKKENLKTTYEQGRERISIASFSKRNDISLMWSYYAKSHSGIVIKYEFPEPQIIVDDPAFLYEVEYMKEIKKIDYRFGDKESYLKWVTTKSFDWEHEKEVRFIHFNDRDKKKKRLVHYPHYVVKEITFGVNTSNEHMLQIKKIVDDVYSMFEIKFSRMRIGDELFTIKEVPQCFA